MISSQLFGAADAQHATPYYVLDLDGMASTCRVMIDAWRSQFPTFTLAYSYKTNTISAVTRTLREAGASAEVVSGPELEHAVADGHEGSNIFFDGPVKHPHELAHSLRVGARIQVDSLTEVKTLIGLLRSGEHPPPLVSLRVASRIGRGKVSRFGLTEGEFGHAAEMLAERGIRVSGLHFNTGQHPTTARPYREHLSLYAGLLRSLIAANPERRITVDIGGGFPAASSMNGRPLPHPITFATSVAEQFDVLGIPRELVHLVIEPGRSLVEDHGALVSSVAAIKNRGNHRLAVLDAGTNLVRSIRTWAHPVQFTRAGQVPYDVYGAMCFEDDVFARDLRGPADLMPGDRLIVGAAGGYDIPSANEWLRPRPAVYATTPNGESQLTTIQREGSYGDSKCACRSEG